MPTKGGNDRPSSGDSTVERGSFGPVRRSATEDRYRHLVTVFGLIS